MVGSTLETCDKATSQLEKINLVEREFHNIESTRLLLRRFKEVDIDSFYGYRSDPEVEKYQGWGEFTLDDCRLFVAAVKDSNPGKPGDRSQMAIELTKTSAMIGDLYFHVFNDDSQQAEIGYSLARQYQGHGYATEAVKTLLEYAFGTLRLHRITAGVDSDNVRSIALLERIGMRREGHLVQNGWFRGRWTDEYQYAILRDEWLNSDR